jgi:hypothetical protein
MRWVKTAFWWVSRDSCSVRMAAGGIPQSMRRRAARADSGGCLESKALPPEIKMRGLLPAR